MTDERDEIKAILDRAFTPEPALGLDRDEVFRRGHRQVRNRRLLTSGGVVLSVVAVVLGVAALTGVLRKDPGEDVAASSTVPSSPQVPTSSVQAAPPGPALPLPPSTTAPLPASAEEHAWTLTKVLSSSGVLPGPFKVLAAEPNSTPLEFRYVDGSYRTTALLLDARGRGVLIIEVRRAARGDTPPRCPNPKECTAWTESGVAGAARTARTAGTVEYSVDALRPDSTRVIVLATNVATTRSGDSFATRPEPPVDLKQLRILATLPGLVYG